MYELESQQAKEELNKTKAENALKLDLLTLAQLIVVKDVDNFDVYVPETFPEETLGLVSANSIYESAVTHRPEIKSAEYRLLSSEKDVLVNKAGSYPTLSLVASSNTYYYNGTNAVNDPFSSQFKNNWNTSVGLSLKIPIFNQFQVKNSVAKAKIAVESSKVDLSTRKGRLEKKYRTGILQRRSCKISLGSCAEHRKWPPAKHTASAIRNMRPDEHRSTTYIRPKVT